MNLTHVRLLVTRFKDCFRFYRDVLELETSFPEHDGPYAEFKLGGDRYLALFDRALNAEAVGAGDLPSTAEAQDRVALIFEVPDVDATADALEARGVELVAGPTDRPAWGLRTAHLRDPDGNLIEVYSGIPHEE